MNRPKALLLTVLCLFLLAACEQEKAPDPQDRPAVQNAAEAGLDPDTGLKITGHMELLYAEEFSVTYLAGDAALIDIENSGRFLLLPPEGDAPAGLSPKVTVLHAPIENIYLAASSGMDFFRELDGLDKVRFTSTSEENWRAFPQVLEALDSGSMFYVGRYSAPDYESLLEGDTDLAVESTMIYHSPKVSEYLRDLDIPVLVERSSYEAHPLGRMEWIKLYGLLLGKADRAEAFFDRELTRLEPLLERQPAGERPTVAFFSLSSNGYATVRKPGDYISRMIDMAGGEYVFSNLPGQEENDLSTLNMQLEAFYQGARDADILIYNSTIEAELYTMEDLLDKSELLSGFRAVSAGNVWCTGKDMFQQVTALGEILSDFGKILADPEVADGELHYLHRLT